MQRGDLFTQRFTRAAVVDHVVGGRETLGARRLRMMARTSSSESPRARTRSTCTSSGQSTTRTRSTRLR